MPTENRPSHTAQPPKRRRVNDGQVVLEGVPEIPLGLANEIRRYQNVRDATFYDFSADGQSIYLATRFGETQQLHRVDVPLGARHQLTFFDEPVRAARRRPGSDEWAYLIDEGGTERYQIHLFEAETGEVRRLTDGRSKHGSHHWSPNGRRLAFQSTRRDGRSLDVWILDVDSAGSPNSPASPGSAVCVVEAKGGSWWAPVAWSADGERLLLLQYLGASRCRAHLLHFEGGGHGFTLEPLAGSATDDRYYEPAGFDPSGQGIYLLSDSAADHRELVHLDLASGQRQRLTADLDWSVSSFRMSMADDGSPRGAFVVNEEGFGRLHLFDPATGRHTAVRAVEKGLVSGIRFSPDARRLGFSFEQPTAPRDVWVLDLDSDPLGFGTAIAWTESETGGLPRSRFAVPELVRFSTFDAAGGSSKGVADGGRRTIPAFVYRPTVASTAWQAPPWPVVIRIHGGPESQARPGWNGNLQMWIDRLGLAVVVPNVRGSAGYGRSYLALDDGFAREDSVRDIGALLDWIDTQDDLDSERVAVYGGSYGGYMVLASLVHFGRRLRCGIELVGISNFVTFLENTQAYRRDLRRAEYGDERDPEMRRFLESISPMSHADRIVTPLFVGQGHNDPRVPASEAEQIVGAVRAGGQEVWYLDALDEGHGFQKKVNRDLWEQTVVLFLERHLLDVRRKSESAEGPATDHVDHQG